MSHLPAGTSTRTFVHYAQLFQNDGRFTKYSHATSQKDAVEEYDLGNVKAKTYLYYGDGDR